MQFKADWEMTKKRFDAFWNCDMLDRCCLAVTSPRNDPVLCEMSLPSPKDLMERWTNPEIAYATYMWMFSCSFLGGEALPALSGSVGPGVIASFLGADYTLGDETVWFGRKPIIRDLRLRAPLSLNEKHELWEAVQRMTLHFTEHAPGKFIVGMPDLGGSFDIAVSLRGSQNLIFDLMDTPGDLMRLIWEISEAWFGCFDRLFNIIFNKTGGMTSWIPLWYPGRWYPLQCDFCASISPRLFDSCVRPSLEKESSNLDKAIYHMDGPAALKYLDSILDIETIHGIQWAPGDTGVPESSVAHDKWFPMYEKIQRKKRMLVLLDVKPAEIEKILNNLSAKGLFLATRCESEDEARELLKYTEKWSRA